MLDGADQTLSILEIDPQRLLGLSSLIEFRLQLSNLEDISLKLKLPRDMSDTSIKTLHLDGNAFYTLPAILYERPYPKLESLRFSITPRPTSFIVRLSAVEYANARFNLRDSLDNKTNIANLFESQDKGFTDIAFRGDCGDLPSNTAFTGGVIVCVDPSKQQVDDTVSSESPAATAAAAPPAATRKQGSNNVVVIISSIVASIVMLTVLLAIVLWRKRRRHAKTHSPVFLELASSASSSKRQPVIRAPKPLDLSSYDPLELKSSTQLSVPHRPLVDVSDDAIAALQIPMHELTVSQLLSRGTFGEVFLGHFHGHRVAVKRLAPERRQDEYERSAFLSEAKLMATLQHERIIQFVGVAWDDPLDVHVVTEFMDGGDLRTLLQTFNDQGRPVGFDACKLQIARHVIEGLAYLHSLQPAVLHRDLKSRNVLLSADAQRAKLIDFGVSRLRADQNSSTMTTCVGTLRWMAPEVMVGGRYGESADVFSFGVVLSELDTHEIPYNVGGESMPTAPLSCS
ncbi:hypothetical protein PINS_up023201 [Pythium insidiosum]|nr:hypothetical protein PINS_up023201 [Pythium insidiosum]